MFVIVWGVLTHHTLLKPEGIHFKNLQHTVILNDGSTTNGFQSGTNKHKTHDNKTVILHDFTVSWRLDMVLLTETTETCLHVHKGMGDMNFFICPSLHWSGQTLVYIHLQMYCLLCSTSYFISSLSSKNNTAET